MRPPRPARPARSAPRNPSRGGGGWRNPVRLCGVLLSISAYGSDADPDRMFGRIRNSAYLRRAAQREVSLSQRSLARGPVILESAFGMSRRNGDQYDDPDFWHAWGAYHNWAPRQVIDIDGTRVMGEWQQCEHCSKWLFYCSGATSTELRVGDYLCLSHRPEGRFFCTPCFELCVDMDEGELCSTCGTRTEATAHEVDHGAGIDEYGQWHCCQCWEEYDAAPVQSAEDQYSADEAEDEGEEAEGEEAEGEEGSWCGKCDTFFPGEYSDFGWQNFVCAECTDESASGSASVTAAPPDDMSKHDKNEADVGIVKQLTVVGRLGLCPFYVYWTHVRGRTDSCDGRCKLVHDSPGGAALGEVLFADPPKLYCCSGTNPPCLEPANLQRATGYSSAAEWINSLPRCALPIRQRPAPSPTPTILSPPSSASLPPTPHWQHPYAIWAISICNSRNSTASWACPLPAARSHNVGLQKKWTTFGGSPYKVHPGGQPPRPYTRQQSNQSSFC